jgi:hypothetical protein
MDDEVIRMALERDFDVSQLPCHLLAYYWYIRLALEKKQ